MNAAATHTLRIAVPLPVKGTFSYKQSSGYESLQLVGCRAVVPFGGRKVTGYILEISKGETLDGLKEIHTIIDAEPLFTEQMVPFFEWVSGYYSYPLGLVIKSVLPARRNSAGCKTATLTGRGLDALESIALGPYEKGILSWIYKNPHKPLKWSIKEISHFRKKGWILIRDVPARMESGHLMRKFVRPRNDISVQKILFEKAGQLRAENEEEFLRELVDSGSLPLSVVYKKFRNGAYLVKKWSEKGVLESYTETVFRDPEGRIIAPSPVPAVLFPQQTRSLGQIRKSLDDRKFCPFLFHGVTGSGKTEVYIRAAEHCIRLGRKVLLMVPEISLAVYMEGIFRSRLGKRIGVYHSELSTGERHDQWVRMARGDIDLVIGARSALFSPLRDIGLIIVDEEHDLSYKQDVSPRYNARDAAVVRAKLEQAVVVLGSGTPSIQSYHNCRTGKYHLLSMSERIENRPMPQFEIVDMKALEERGGKNRMLTPALIQAIDKNLRDGHQTILFLNRRGFHRLFLCPKCGKSMHCPYCDVTLTHHYRENFLSCHYCGYSTEIQVKCPSCGKAGLKPYGFGTEKLEHELTELFPEASCGRMDADSTRRKGQSFQLLKRFNDHKIDILVGTQMVTKGYDFPRVTLVGIVAADLSLEFPDFRGGERTFQLLSQVAGRAGRGSLPGKVLIQTFNPGHYAIQTAMDHDYDSFFKNEIALREQLNYPPFSYLACLKLQGNSQEKTGKAAGELSRSIKDRLKSRKGSGKDVLVLGPAEAPIFRLRGKYRWHILLKCRNAALLQHLVEEIDVFGRKITGSGNESERVSLILDVDPYNMI